MLDRIYLVDEEWGIIVPLKAGRYRVVRNHDECQNFDCDIPKKLATSPGSIDLGYI
ncbi:hypothetical protein GOC48_25325 [Sinorhizobium meliloti]|nr:hypothetical protein [Sinorhizobium meliloti]